MTRIAGEFQVSEMHRPFFGAIARLVPQATCVFVVALMQPYLEHTQYEAPIGTVWSWPQQNHRFVLTSHETTNETVRAVPQEHGERGRRKILALQRAS